MSLLVTLNGLRLLRAREPAVTTAAKAPPASPACTDGCCAHD
jgi:hypothetical protein